MESFLEASAGVRNLLEVEMKRVAEAHSAMEKEVCELEKKKKDVQALEAQAKKLCTEAEEKEKAARLERLRLDESWKQLEQERDAFQKERQVMQDLNVQEGDVIKINAGGTVFQTARSTLCLVPDSMLAAMFSGRWEKGLKRDADGVPFIDVSPTVFEMVLSHLRAMAFKGQNVSFPEVPPTTKAEVEAFLGFTFLTDVVADPAAIDFQVTSFSGDFCGGSESDLAAPDVRYSEVAMGQILRGSVPDDASVKHRAIYTYPAAGEHVIRLAFSKPCSIAGCHVKIARNSACRWRFWKDDDPSPICISTGQSWQLSGMSGCVSFSFDMQVKAHSLCIIIDEVLSGNVGFYKVSFF